MSPDAQPAGVGAAQGRLTPHTSLGNDRIVIESLRYTGLFGEVYLANDKAQQRPVSVHLLHPAIGSDAAALLAVRAGLVAATQGSHPSIARPLELSAGAPWFVVTELLEGHSLRQLLERKRETGTRGFTPRGARNILVQIVSALEAAGSPHGALGLDAVTVDKAGHVAVADFGLWPLLPAAHAGGLAVGSLAPEVVAGGKPTITADVYGIGAILYELLMGSPPEKGCPRPSEVLGVGAALDGLIGSCVHDQPEKRIGDYARLRAELSRILAEGGKSGERAAVSAERPAVPAGAISAAAAAAAPAAPSKKSARPSLAQSITAPRATGPGAAVDPASALSRALTDSEERWLISKDRMDYGPFPLAEVVEQIRINKVMPGHYVVDNMTGDRTAVEEHPLLSAVVEEAKRKRDDARRAEAEVQHAQVEKRRGTTLYAFIAVGVLALGGGVYGVYRALSSGGGKKVASVESLDEASLQVNFSMPTVEAEPPRDPNAKRPERHPSGRPGAPHAGPGNQGNWEDPLDLGDVSQGESGGDERLDASQINPVLQRHGGALGRCLSSTSTKNAKIRFIIKGNGSVSYVDVNGSGGSPAAGCVRSVMKSMKFPPFDGARTRFSVNLSI